MRDAHDGYVDFFMIFYDLIVSVEAIAVTKVIEVRPSFYVFQHVGRGSNENYCLEILGENVLLHLKLSRT